MANISHFEWLTADTADTSRERKTYGYSYDRLNRLKAGFYYKEVSGNYSFTEVNNEILGYDINGNISNLDRYAYKINNLPSKIDELQYFYSGNRLLKITDAQSDATKLFL